MEPRDEIAEPLPLDRQPADERLHERHLITHEEAQLIGMQAALTVGARLLREHFFARQRNG
jgi:hypothetical protein